LKAAHQAAQSAFEPGDQATIEFFETSMLRVGLHSRFFSRGVGRFAASVRPTQTHQCMARAIIRTRRSNRSASPSCESSSSKPRLFEVGKHRLYSPARTIIQHRRRVGGQSMAIIQGSGCPGSCKTPKFVMTPRANRGTFGRYRSSCLAPIHRWSLHRRTPDRPIRCPSSVAGIASYACAATRTDRRTDKNDPPTTTPWRPPGSKSGPAPTVSFARRSQCSPPRLPHPRQG